MPAVRSGTSLLDGRYQLMGRSLGTGGHGRVELAKDVSTGELVVIKTNQSGAGGMQSSRKALQCQQTELDNLRNLSHPNVIKLLSAFRPSGSELCLVLEYANGSDLRTWIAKNALPSEELVLQILTQMLLGLAYCHNMGFIHRDIKPGNVFLFQKDRARLPPLVKLGDFGIARFLEEGDLATTVVMTPQYAAPEVLAMEPYDAKADIWGCGLVLFELCAGHRLFPQRTKGDIVASLSSWRPPQLPGKYSAELGDLLRRMLCKDPARRPSAQQILQDVVIVANQIGRLERMFRLELSQREPPERPAVPDGAGEDQELAAAIAEQAALRAMRDSQAVADALAESMRLVPARIDLGNPTDDFQERLRLISTSARRIHGEERVSAAMIAARAGQADAVPPDLYRACEAMLMLQRMIDVESGARAAPGG